MSNSGPARDCCRGVFDVRWLLRMSGGNWWDDFQAPDMSRLDASEEDKIKAMMSLSNRQYDSST